MRTNQFLPLHRLRHAARIRRIVGVFAKLGFEDLAERAKFGRFLFAKTADNAGLGTPTPPERLRQAFEELGPTFVKFGQLLATRPDLIPVSYAEEFKKLHDQVPPTPFNEIAEVLVSQYGANWRDRFLSFDETPLAAASIAQVHRATLRTEATPEGNTEVVLKIQRPNIRKIIRQDQEVLYALAEFIARYIPQARLFDPVGLVDEFFRSLDLETNFVVEANNIRRFQKNFRDFPTIKIPQVYEDLTTEQVLVLEALDGIPLSQVDELTRAGMDPHQILRNGLRAYLKMVFTDGLFHGDLHAGNIFALADGRVGLIDFGMVGRLNRRTQTSIANMLLALAREDYERFAFEYVDLAPYSEHVEVDRFARQLRDLIAPYYGLTLEHMNLGQLLMESAAIAARHRLVLPSELLLYFKSIVSIEGVGRSIVKDFDFLSYSLEFATELTRARLEPQRLWREWTDVNRDVQSLLLMLPRQAKQAIRKLNSPDFSLRVHVPEAESLRRSVDRSARLQFWAIVSGALLIGSAILAAGNVAQNSFLDPTPALVVLICAAFIVITALFRFR